MTTISLRNLEEKKIPIHENVCIIPFLMTNFIN